MALPTSSDSSMYENGYIGPDGKPDVKQGEAPAGLWPSESELPVISVPGGTPMTTGGYTPSPAQPSLPPPGSTEGAGLPPTSPRK